MLIKLKLLGTTLCLLLCVGCSDKAVKDPYGLQENLENSSDYEKSLQSMEKRYEEEITRVKGHKNSVGSKDKPGVMETLKNLFSVKRKGEVKN